MNKNVKSLFFIFAVAVTMNVSAKEKASESASPQTKILMSEFAEQLNAITGFMISEKKFSDPKNSIEIGEHLKKLSQVAKASLHDPQLSLENFKVSRDVLVSHISETEKVFRSGNKGYARWMLNSTIFVCMSCHTQMPTKDRKQLFIFDNKSYFSQFEQAEFLFASRSFTEASNIYDSIIRGMIKDAGPDVEKALQRQVAYYARVKRDPAAAVTVFKRYLKLKNMPEYIRRDLENWISAFEGLKKEKIFQASKADDKSILTFIADQSKNVNENENAFKVRSNHPRLVNDLYVTGELYEFLQTHPASKVIPQVLYQLAILERSIDRNVFFSLADLYLRECVTKYAADPFAKKCYKELEQETILGYSGSRGTEVPDDVREDLKVLKSMVDSGGKVKVDSQK